LEDHDFEFVLFHHTNPNRFRPNAKRPDGKRYIAMFEGSDEKLPIKRVIIGPGTRRMERAESARALLGDIEITLSECAIS
jgi:hypothetical protein